MTLLNFLSAAVGAAVVLMIEAWVDLRELKALERELFPAADDGGGR